MKQTNYDLTNPNDRVRYIRHKLNLDLKEFSFKSNISYNTVFNIEHNKTTPTPRTLKAINKNLGLKSSWLVNGIGSPDFLAENPAAINQSEATDYKRLYFDTLAKLKQLEEMFDKYVLKNTTNVNMGKHNAFEHSAGLLVDLFYKRISLKNIRNDRSNVLSN